ncbi:hypothetical protein AMECASPLE_001354 [Ameca splendens]|uniref:Uncharacterized protein n=1 Tax=Ameca splendens TaxID=208324 RepID=A0ABV0Y9L2_9TELE
MVVAVCYYVPPFPPRRALVHLVIIIPYFCSTWKMLSVVLTMKPAQPRGTDHSPHQGLPVLNERQQNRSNSSPTVHPGPRARSGPAAPKSKQNVRKNLAAPASWKTTIIHSGIEPPSSGNGHWPTGSQYSCRSQIQSARKGGKTKHYSVEDGVGSHRALSSQRLLSLGIYSAADYKLYRKAGDLLPFLVGSQSGVREPPRGPRDTKCGVGK